MPVKNQTTHAMKTKSTPTKKRPQAGQRRALGLATGSALSVPAIARHIAREIYADGDDPRGKCTRLQCMIGKPKWPDEITGGGFCEIALATRISAALRSLPNIATQTGDTTHE